MSSVLMYSNKGQYWGFLLNDEITCYKVFFSGYDNYVYNL